MSAERLALISRGWRTRAAGAAMPGFCGLCFGGVFGRATAAADGLFIALIFQESDLGGEGRGIFKG
jgi:hypothetical protein